MLRLSAYTASISIPAESRNFARFEKAHAKAQVCADGLTNPQFHAQRSPVEETHLASHNTQTLSNLSYFWLRSVDNRDSSSALPRHLSYHQSNQHTCKSPAQTHFSQYRPIKPAARPQNVRQGLPIERSISTRIRINTPSINTRVPMDRKVAFQS